MLGSYLKEFSIPKQIDIQVKESVNELKNLLAKQNILTNKGKVKMLLLIK